MKFKEKVVSCLQEKIHIKTEEMQEKWLVALLQRARVNQDIIQRALTDSSYSKSSWREHLFFNHGIEIMKHSDRVVITKYSDRSDPLKLGEWKDPTVIHTKKDGKKVCELHLNYWQII